MKPFLLLRTLLFASCSTVIVVVVSGADELLDCTLSSLIPLGRPENGARLGLRQRMNLVEKTATIQFIYEGQAWLGIGRSSRDGWMIGGEAVIGLPDEPLSATNPGKYSLFTEDEDGVQLMEAQTLQDASIFQNETHTVLTYTKLLEEPGELSIPADEGTRANWIWAVGSDNSYPSVHAMEGSFNIELWPCSVIEEEEEQEEEQEDEATTGNDNATQTSNNDAGTTERDIPPDFGFVEVASKESTNRPLWKTHGYFMAFSWGLCVPIAIGASILRNVVPCWFLLHRIFNALALLFTIIGFCVAVAAMEEEGGQHFKENKHTKAGLAVFVIIVLQVIFGVFRPSTANQQKHKEIDETDQKKAEGRVREEEEMEDDEQEVDVEVKEQAQARYEQGKDGELEVISDNYGLHKEQDQTMEFNSEDGTDDEATTKQEDDTEDGKKSLSRHQLWKYTHRAVGIAVVGLAWHTCHLGIEEYEGKYVEQDGAATIAFWAVTGTISGIIIFFAYVIRV